MFGGGEHYHPPQPPPKKKVLPTKPYEEIDKKALFLNFLFLFTFARRTKKIIFFFVKNQTKKCKKIAFSLSQIKITFSKFTFFKTQENKKI
jgi:hypothetical protein